MKLILGLVLSSSVLTASGLAADPPRRLGEAELDGVTAGDASATASGIGTTGPGGAALVSTHTVAHGLHNPGTRTDRDDLGVAVYASEATASGFTTDGAPLLNTAATTSSSQPGAQTTTRNWGVSVLGVGIRSSFSHTASPSRDSAIFGP